MKLIVAADDDQTAQGTLFWDDGDSIGESTNLIYKISHGLRIFYYTLKK